MNAIQTGGNAPDAPMLAESLSTTMLAHAVGQSLARLREARGWTLADVSVRLKFSERQITALEAEHWSELPQGLSLRGLVRNYARLLGTDPDTLLAALAPQIGAVSAGSASQRSSSHLASERAAHLMSQEPDRRFPGGWVIGVIAVAALAAVAAYALGWWPGGSGGAAPALPAAPVMPE